MGHHSSFHCCSDQALEQGRHSSLPSLPPPFLPASPFIILHLPLSPPPPFSLPESPLLGRSFLLFFIFQSLSRHENLLLLLLLVLLLLVLLLVLLLRPLYPLYTAPPSLLHPPCIQKVLISLWGDGFTFNVAFKTL